MKQSGGMGEKRAVMNRWFDRRDFLKALAGATLAMPQIARGAQTDRKPTPPLNILFVFADQMHGFAMGCMGNPEIRTPNLDQLAKEGTLFRNTYSCAPVCTPFRATLFTGRYGSQTGILSNGLPLPKGEPTLADRLNGGGYRTSYVGKWHFGGTGNKWVPPELRGGFTDFIGYQCYNDYVTDVRFFDEEGKETRCSKHRTDATTDIAIQRLEHIAKGRFALFVSYQNPHYPVQPSPEYEAMYEGVKITRRPNCQEIDPYIATASPPAPKPKETDPVYKKYGGNLDKYLQLYYAMVTQLDANIGRLLQAVDRLGLRDNTVVIFTSDHGDMQGSHGLKNKSVFWEESSRIPLIVRVAGGVRGLQSDALISSVDFFPACVGYANLPPEPKVEGVNFAPLTRGEPQDLSNRPIFSESGGWAMARRDAFKLAVEKNTMKPTHLFDLKADPYEMKNLVEGPAHAETRAKLLATVTDWYQRVSKDRPAKERKTARSRRDKSGKK